MREPRARPWACSKCRLQQALLVFLTRSSILFFTLYWDILSAHKVLDVVVGQVLSWNQCSPCLFHPLSFSIQVNRVMTYRDLDNDLMKYSAFQTLVSGPTSAQTPGPPWGMFSVPPELCTLLNSTEVAEKCWR